MMKKGSYSVYRSGFPTMFVFAILTRMHGMKILTVGCLCLAMLLSGCYSYQSLTSNERTSILTSSSEDIEVTLKDGSGIEVDSYHYAFTDALDSFIFGKGEVYSMRGERPAEFVGRIHPTRIDSGYLDMELWTGSVHYYDFWISDSSKVRCKPADILFVNGGQIPTFWYRLNGNSVGIPQNIIEKVEGKKFSITKTGFFIVGTGLMVGLLAWYDARMNP